MQALRSSLGTLSVQSVLDAKDGIIEEAINKVGFWRRKAQYIRQTAKRLREDFGDDVPKTVEELCDLPGVGPKMAYLTLSSAWKLYGSRCLYPVFSEKRRPFRNAGIGVDVHVHRITNRLGWHKPPTKNPEETRVNLESWLPVDLYQDINHMLVGFGQVQISF